MILNRVKLKNCILNTTGDGYWSRDKCQVKCYKCQISYLDHEQMDYGLLDVYFNQKAWNVRTQGLIYTDSNWLRDFRKYLRKTYGLTISESSDVGYSEQGMQGDNYVSLDFGDRFLLAWFRKIIKY